MAIEAPAVDAPRKKIKRPAFLEKKPRRKAEPKPEAPIQEEELDFAAQCREQLIQLYERYNPDKVKDVDDLLAKYAGREPLLISAVEAKYSGAQGVPLFKDEALVRAGAELVEREAEAREAELIAARLRAESAQRPRAWKRASISRRRSRPSARRPVLPKRWSASLGRSSTRIRVRLPLWSSRRQLI